MVESFQSVISNIAEALTTGSAAVILIIILIALFVQKELASSASGSRFRKLEQALNIGIVPLFILFLLIIAFKLIEVIK